MQSCWTCTFFLSPKTTWGLRVFDYFHLTNKEAIVCLFGGFFGCVMKFNSKSSQKLYKMFHIITKSPSQNFMQTASRGIGPASRCIVALSSFLSSSYSFQTLRGYEPHHMESCFFTENFQILCASRIW